MNRRIPPVWRLLVLAIALVMIAAACGEDSDSDSGSDGGSGLSGTITVDGSSTVAPLTSAAEELFTVDNPDVQIPVGTSGTGGGFKKFCAGETDISDASRPIKADDEFEGLACEKNDIEYEELTVANDGLAVVVNIDNDWAECLTIEQLNTIWAPDSTVSNWNEVDPSFPDESLTLFGPGTASGTFDYFTEAVNGEEGSSRSDYGQSEDDNQIVTGVAGSKGAMGYFGLSYAEENADTLKAVEIDGGEGCVAPSIETVQDGTYQPLGRPLFIYPSADILKTDYGLAFVEFYIENSDEIAESALFVPLTEEQKTEALAQVEALAGS